jgi:hypothetical protein
VVLATGTTEIEQIDDASTCDTSSTARDPHLGEIVVWQSAVGYYLATKIEKLQARDYGSAKDEMTSSCVIQTVFGLSNYSAFLVPSLGLVLELTEQTHLAVALSVLALSHLSLVIRS